MTALRNNVDTIWDEGNMVPAPYPELAMPCRLWTGSTFSTMDYGFTYLPGSDGRKGQTVPVHRLAWVVATFGRWDPSLLPRKPSQVCHHCDRPTCFEPSHLYLGDAKQNAQDKVRRGRHVNGFQRRREFLARLQDHPWVDDWTVTTEEPS